VNIATFNYIEAGLWFCLGLSLLAWSLIAGKKSEHKKLATVAGAAFLLFGVTDIIEASTGAWWRPLWLLGLKGLCIGIFTYCFYIFRKRSKV